MGRNNTRVTLAILGQKLDDLKEDVNEIKGHTKTINGCIKSNEIAIRTIDTNFANHISSHKRDIVLVTIFISALAIAINLLPYVM